MADIGGYRHHVTGYPVMKDYYGSCAADCDQFLAGNCSNYRQYGETCSYDVQPSCVYPVVYGHSGSISNITSPEVVCQEQVSQATYNTGSCRDVSANFRSDCSKLVQDQTLLTSTPVEIYPWMKETRQNHRRQMLAALPG